MEDYVSFFYVPLFILWSFSMAIFVSLRIANKIPDKRYCTSTQAHMNIRTHKG